jgi:hypothetical protein
MTLVPGQDDSGPKITVTVKPQIAGTPTGTVQVGEPGLTLASLPLIQGVAVLYTNGLPGHTVLNFSYGGDKNFKPTAGATLTPPATGLNP